MLLNCFQTLIAGGDGRGSTEPTVSEEEEEERGGEESGERGDNEEAVDSNVGDEGDEHDQLEQQDEVQDEESSSKPVAEQAEFVSGDVFSATSRHKHGTLVPYGLPCVRELLRFLVSIINMRER